MGWVVTNFYHFSSDNPSGIFLTVAMYLIMSYAILMNRKHIKLFADINFISSIYFSKSDLIKCINVPHRNKSSNPANLRIINYKLDVGIFVTSNK
jgi:hypothetical protein